MISNESKLFEIGEINHELTKKKKKQELEQNRVNLAITWTGGNVVCCVGVFFMPGIKDNPWFLFSLFAVCAVIGIPFIFWANSRLKAVNQEIEQLEKRKKELRNSVR